MKFGFRLGKGRRCNLLWPKEENNVRFVFSESKYNINIIFAIVLHGVSKFSLFSLFSLIFLFFYGEKMNLEILCKTIALMVFNGVFWLAEHESDVSFFTWSFFSVQNTYFNNAQILTPKIKIYIHIYDYNTNTNFYSINKI